MTMSEQDQKTLFLCALAALAGYWYAKHGHPCGCNAATQDDTSGDPMAWLGQWQAV